MHKEREHERKERHVELREFLRSKRVSEEEIALVSEDTAEELSDNRGDEE